MSINTFKYFFLDAAKSLKRNITITIFSIVSISTTTFIVGLFLLYLLLVNTNSGTIFTDYKEMIVALRWLEVAVLFVLPVISLFLIVNAFKMALFPRRNEINIMKFVGATNWFIRWPFIIEGALIGISGTFIGNLLLFFAYSFIYTKAINFAPELNLVQPTFVTGILLLRFMIAGAIIGPLGNIIALRKILRCVVWED